MKTLYLITTAILLPILALSQNLEKLDYTGEVLKNDKDEICFFSAMGVENQIINTNDFFNNILEVENTDEFRLGITEDEGKIEMYNQYYNSIPVKDGVYVLHWKNGKIESANGNYIRITSKLNPKPVFTESEAIEKWYEYLKIPSNNISSSEIKLFVT